MKAYRGSTGIAPLILNLGTRCRWVVNFTPRPLYSREITPVPIEQEAGRATEPDWTFCKREKSLAATRIRIPDHPSRSLVVIPTTLSRHIFMHIFITRYNRAHIFVHWAMLRQLEKWGPERIVSQRQDRELVRFSFATFRVTTTCSVVIRHKRFGETCCLSLRLQVSPKC